MHPLVRGLAIVALLAALGGLCIHYADTAGAHHPYPTQDDLATDYDAYVGEDVRLFATVKQVDEAADTATVRVDSSAGSFRMTVDAFDVQVNPGGVVQVYGTLRANHEITAQNVAVVNPAGASKAYKYGVSVVGALLVLAVFFRSWEFDADVLAFEVGRDG